MGAVPRTRSVLLLEAARESLIEDEGGAIAFLQLG
jgi:hypothetical protein